MFFSISGKSGPHLASRPRLHVHETQLLETDAVHEVRLPGRRYFGKNVQICWKQPKISMKRKFEEEWKSSEKKFLEIRRKVLIFYRKK